MLSSSADPNGPYAITAALQNEEKKSKCNSGSSQCCLAVTSLILSTFALIMSLIIAITVIPNLDSSKAAGTTGGAATSTEGEGAAVVNNTDIIMNTGNNTVTIVNETNKYYNENITTYVDVNCSCPANVYGIINVNKTYQPGGYYGWYYNSYYKSMYPFTDIHASVGDTIKFVAQSWTPEDVWLVTEEVYNDCESANASGWRMQLAIQNELRSDQPQFGAGYYLLLQNWHVREWGDILYFSSYTGCVNGVKVKVFIEEREAIPVILDDISALDLSASDTVKDLEAALGHLSRTLVLSQFSTEQRIRSEGDSGLTHSRGHYDGERQYDDGSYFNDASASIHDHSDFIRVVGIGEIEAVLNGVEFQTRHNDYNLNMPHRTSSEYHAVERIEPPEVPPEVLSIRNITEQINEMIEWFRAFKTQNSSHRNYSKYFVPILCYLEGAWILDDSILSEPFDSDRHSLDASTWKQLHDKFRWMTNSGRKNTAENLAHLPSSIRNLYNDTYPIISNWEYRILCHPLKNDIPTSRFKVVNDISLQLFGSPETRKELKYSRKARFELQKYINLNNPSFFNPNNQWNEGRKRWNYLDYLMEQIPGKDNYIANLTDILPDGTSKVVHFNNGKYINSGYYSRFYGLTNKDAMGSTGHRRGWSDRYLFAAKTTQKKVSPISMDYEMDNIIYPTISRWTYAIPLEIIYMTPLTKWNPYNITYLQHNDFFNNLNKDRSGSCIIGDEYIGWTENNAYFTPSSFFESDESSNNNDADTAKNNICALDNNNIPQNVAASGHWITFPSIANGVGLIRQRYPIFPIHYGGSLAFKEIKAFQDMTLNINNYDDIKNGLDFWKNDRDLKYGINLKLIGGAHEHDIYIDGWRIYYYWFDHINEIYLNGSNYLIEEYSDIANQHQHTLKIYRYRINDNSPWMYKIEKCRFGTQSDINQTLYPWQENNCQDFHNHLIRDK